jgi:hypothetical protein
VGKEQPLDALPAEFLEDLKPVTLVIQQTFFIDIRDINVVSGLRT